MNYTLPTSDKKGFAILSVDPGSVNAGLSCSLVNPKTFELTLLANVVMENPIKGLTKDFDGKRRAFIRELDYWVDTYNVKAFYAERFQSRGNGGTLIEEVNMMLGMVAQRYRKMKPQFITAATWKNDWHRQHDEYELKDIYKVCAAAPHQVDATLIGLYGLQKIFNRKYTYTVKSMVKGIEHCNLSKAFNRKIKFEDLQ